MTTVWSELALHEQQWVKCQRNHDDRSCLSTVLVEQYTNYEVSLNDKWVMRGSTAVFRCAINPLYVTDYVKVIGWTRGDRKLYSGERRVHWCVFWRSELLGLLVVWLLDWLVGWLFIAFHLPIFLKIYFLICNLISSLADWLICSLIDWLIWSRIGWLICSLISWYNDWVTVYCIPCFGFYMYFLMCWLICSLTDWFVHCLIDLFIVWLICSLFLFVRWLIDVFISW